MGLKLLQNKMSKGDFSEAHATMSKYVKGIHPLEGGYPWFSVDHIYGLAHVLKCHWVAYDIDIKERRITVYDSRSKKKYWSRIKAEFSNVSRFIPWVLNLHAAGDELGARLPYQPWEIVQFQHPPQQDNDHDCGVMAIKFLECLVSGNPVGIIDPLQTWEYRKTFCVELFNLTKEGRQM